MSWCSGSLQLPPQGFVLHSYLRDRAAGHQGPGAAWGHGGAEQTGAADVTVGQLASGGLQPVPLLKDWIGEAGGGSAGGPVRQRTDRQQGLLQPLSPELVLYACSLTLLQAFLPLLEVPHPSASEQNNTSTEQDDGECQHGQHSSQDHAAAP